MSNITIISIGVISVFVLVALASFISVIWDQIDANKKLEKIIIVLNETKRPIKGCDKCIYEYDGNPNRPCNKCQRAYMDCYEMRDE